MRHLLLAFSAALVTGTVGCGRGAPSLPAGPSSTPATPAPRVRLQVLFPPRVGSAAYGPVAAHLVGNPAVSGAVVAVPWSDFDLGDTNTGAHTAYDFSIPDREIAPWIAAGKTASLVLQNTTYGGGSCPPSGPGSRGTSGTGNCAMPAWMWTALAPAASTVCATSDGGTQRTPDFRSTDFRRPYEAALAALVAHYDSAAGIGYVRVGLGKGGETNLPGGWDDLGTPCGQSYSSEWGYTVGATAGFTWNLYLEEMVSYAASLRPRTPLMVSITPVTSRSAPATAVPDFLAPIAIANGFGIGNQGLQHSDVVNAPVCSGDWCEIFSTYASEPLLELQTLGPSCPSGTGTCGADGLSNLTGSLVPLLPFALAHHASVLEIYTDDWLVAYDPANPGYGAYGASYRQALEAVQTVP